MLDEKIEKFFTVGKSQNKFTISKCHINTIDRIISNKRFSVYIKLSLIDNFANSPSETFPDFWSIQGLLNKSYNR